MSFVTTIKKAFFISLSLTALSFFFAAPALATSGNNVHYPIRELGNCRDARECQLYCEIPVNESACTQYEQFHFLTKVLGDTTNVTPTAGPITISTSATAAVNAAGVAVNGISAVPPSTGIIAPAPYVFPISELGNCKSAQECSTFCSKTENRELCTQFFIKKSGTPPTPTSTQINPQFLQDAESLFGCTSVDTCKTFCAATENHQKCEDFARSEGAKGVYPNLNRPTGLPNALPGQQVPGLGAVDCTKTENIGKCRSMGMMCSSFCAVNPKMCSSSGLHPLPVSPSGRPVPTFRPLQTSGISGEPTHIPAPTTTVIPNQ